MAEEKVPKTFFETDDKGNVLEISMETGEIVRKSASYGKALVDPDAIPPSRIWKYSRRYGELICQLIATGATFKKICSMDGMPSAHVLARWRAENEDFENALEAARRMRADHFHDMIVEDVEGDHIADKDEVAARKLKMDRLKYLASVNNPDKYGNRTKVSGDNEQPLQIVVSTGINREKE